MKNSVTLAVNKKSVEMNPFVQSVFENVIMGLVATLHSVEEKVEQVEVTVKLEDGGD